ncbi:MAG: carboxypeptidase-like regulatory domain-containing protein [candidate division WOR-3 bacterium]|nr:carboxypeptidase-like regulatory domain-containing protein [candidate division WOR-3 bacterium]
MAKIRLQIIISIIVTLFITCRPDRDNPYDPKSIKTKSSIIWGKVLTKNGLPIENAKVSLLLQLGTKTISTISDRFGNYELDYIYSLNYGDSASVIAEKDGYCISQKPVVIDINRTDTINFTLDAIPQFSAESITSYHEPFLPGDDIYLVNFSVRVLDADGLNDIESVYVLIPELNKTFPLSYTTNNIYKDTVSAELFPDSTLECLIGKDCFFEVLSSSEGRFRSNPYQLSRIIYESPEPLSPILDTTVTQNFPCVWRKLSLPFPFTYEVEIYYIRPDFRLVLAYQKTSIPATDTTITIPSLAPYAGHFFWQVSVRDNLGNISKSVHSLFYYYP